MHSIGSRLCVSASPAAEPILQLCELARRGAPPEGRFESVLVLLQCPDNATGIRERFGLCDTFEAPLPAQIALGPIAGLLRGTYQFLCQ
jgi:hypothetical protein